MEFDGETEVTIGPVAAVNPGYAPVFDGSVSTPTGAIAVETVPLDKLYRMDVGTSVRVRIWTNRDRAPDKIIIGLE